MLLGVGGNDGIMNGCTILIFCIYICAVGVYSDQTSFKKGIFLIISKMQCTLERRQLTNGHNASTAEDNYIRPSKQF